MTTTVAICCIVAALLSTASIVLTCRAWIQIRAFVRTLRDMGY